MIALLAFLLGAGLASLISAWAYNSLIKRWKADADRWLNKYVELSGQLNCAKREPTRRPGTQYLCNVPPEIANDPIAIRAFLEAIVAKHEQHNVQWASLDALIGERTVEEQ